MKDKFEKAFSDFIDCRQYDDAENAVFSLVRAAFAAGWVAAGGSMPLRDDSHMSGAEKAEK